METTLMNKVILAATLGAVLAFGSATALAASHVAGEKTSTWEDVKSWTHEKKNDAVAAGKKMIAATDKKIEEAQAQAKKAGTDTSEAHKQNMKDLQAKKAAAAAQLKKMEKAGATAWTGTRDAFAAAYKDLTESSDKAAGAKK
jgi:uncharacterized iron-regulated membrane protein